MEDSRILSELAPIVEKELNRHISLSKSWNPYEYIPWSQGENYSLLGGREWEETDQKLSSAVQASLLIQLASEDNLPFYMYELGKILGGEDAWMDWLHRWTAEESRHGSSIRDYLVVTRSINPYVLEKNRMDHMPKGFTMPIQKPIPVMVHTAIQELAIRQSYNNTGIESQDPVLFSLLNRISLDENLHMIFYRNMVDACLNLCPDLSMKSIFDSIINYSAPAYKIEGYDVLAAKTALSGIYDLEKHYKNTINPLLRYWKIFERNDFGSDGEKNREKLALFLTDMEQKVKKYSDRKKRKN